MLGLLTGTLFHFLVTTLVLCVFAFIMMEADFTQWGVETRAVATIVAGFTNLLGGLIFYGADLHKDLTRELHDWIAR